MTVGAYVDSVENFDHLSQKEQVKLLAFFHSQVNNKEVFTTSEIKACFLEHNLSMPANISNELSKLIKEKPQFIIKVNNGYSFHRTAKKGLQDSFVSSGPAIQVSKALRDLIPKINSKEQKAFLEEAISCFEIQAYRASILMTWLLTMDVMYEYVITKKLMEFNAAVQTHGKHKKLTFNIKDDFSEIKESDFFELLRVGKLISNDVRKILVEKLDFRNTCAHPNTVVVKNSKAIAVIDDLIENVIFKYQ